jgi:hypothetical protein
MSLNLHPSKLFAEAQKIVEFRKIAPFFAILGICAFTSLIIVIWNSTQPNKFFYQTSIIGTVTDVYSDERDVWYKIGQNWYVIINPMTNNLAIGDSVFKESDSHDIIIFGGADNIKSKGEIEEVGFILLEGMHPKDIKK